MRPSSSTWRGDGWHSQPRALSQDRKSTRLNSSHGYISYAVFCLKKKKKYTPPYYIKFVMLSVQTYQPHITLACTVARSFVLCVHIGVMLPTQRCVYRSVSISCA